MSKEFSIRPYQSGDEQGILELLQLAFNDWAKRKAPLEHWKWRYCDSPIKHLISLAISDDMIIGVNHCSLNNLIMGTSYLPAYFAGDVVTHPNYRGMGIYSKLIDTNAAYVEKNGFKFGYWLSSNPIVLSNNIKRRNEIFPHSISYMVRIRDIDLHLQKRPMENESILRLGYLAYAALNKIKTTLITELKSKENYITEEIKSFDERIDEFWENVKGGYSFILEKNHTYLNWRYCDPRGGDFAVRQVVKDGAVLGFIAIQLTRLDGYLEGFVMDLLALPGRLDVVDALLKDGCDYFDKLGVNAFYYMVVDGHPYQEISEKIGFVNSRRKPYIGCQVNDTENFEIMRSSSRDRIYFGYADTFL
jgi:GNAT superfamily N-acetyltransferase